MAHQPISGSRWRRVKARVIRRDAGICHLCRQPGADSVDHLVPVAKGGELYDLRNLAAAHHNVWPQCNRVRGDRPIPQARRDIAARIHRAEIETADQPEQAWTW